MKYWIFSAACCVFLSFFSTLAMAQVNEIIINGKLVIENTIGVPRPEKYRTTIIDLDKKLKINRNDTTALFKRAFLIEQFNNKLAVPYQDDSKALQNLRQAEIFANRADSLEMKDFKLLVLRAQIYKELAYRFLGDQGWKYQGGVLINRRKDFLKYKSKANELYNKLIELDAINSFDYKNLKEIGEYPIK